MSNLTLRQVFLSTGWLSIDHVFRLAAALIVGIWLARYLGPIDYGKLGYATTLVAIAASFASIAADAITVRGIVNHPEVSTQLASAHFFLRLAGGTILCLLLMGGVTISLPRDMSLLVVVMAMSLLFSPFDAIGVWYQAHLLPQKAVKARLIANIFSTAVRVALIIAGASLFMFGVVFLLEAVLTASILLLFYHLEGKKLFTWPGIDSCRLILKDSWPLLLSGMAASLYQRLDVVMLEAMRGLHEVGIYSAAYRISEAWYFLPMVLITSLQPHLGQLYVRDATLFHARLRSIYVWMAWGAISIALFFTLSANHLVVLLYGKDYSSAAPVLALHAWSSIAVCLGIASTTYLILAGAVKITWYRTIIGLAVNVVLNCMFIPQHGAIGAAVATLISYFVATFSIGLFAIGRQQCVLMLLAFNPAQLITESFILFSRRKTLFLG